METIKTWQERTHLSGVYSPADAMALEIAELRASLASQAESAPVDAVGLPPLPRAAMLVGPDLESLSLRYTKQQMLDYGRAALAQRAATVEAQPIARILHWHGPTHWPTPHGGIAARTYAEFPKNAGEGARGYWKEGAPLHAAPPGQPAPAAGVPRIERDAARLDLLEQMANEPEGLLLHYGGDFTGRRGLGLRRIGRTLRQAVDAMTAPHDSESGGT